MGDEQANIVTPVAAQLGWLARLGRLREDAQVGLALPSGFAGGERAHLAAAAASSRAA
jgi:hypothetical protein